MFACKNNAVAALLPELIMFCRTYILLEGRWELTQRVDVKKRRKALFDDTQFGYTYTSQRRTFGYELLPILHSRIF
jgi:hypothetical protein